MNDSADGGEAMVTEVVHKALECAEMIIHDEKYRNLVAESLPVPSDNHVVQLPDHRL